MAKFINMKRVFESGANRNSDNGKLDYSGFNAPIVDWAFAQYMHSHRKLEDGTLRDSDNWQKGIPRNELLKSLIRHVKDLELIEAGYTVYENGNILDVTDVLCGIRFNVNAMLLDTLNGTTTVDRNYVDTDYLK